MDLSRVGLAIHPRRDLTTPLEQVTEWARAAGVELVQIAFAQDTQVVADPGEPEDCELLVAIGGDGTTLAALHAGARVDRPVLGVACGSLGALTTVPARRAAEALARVEADDWRPRAIPGLDVRGDDGSSRLALNDIAIVRDGMGQVIVGVTLGDEPYARWAGDGVIVATPLGSSAYTLAAGGPLLAPGTDAVVITPLAPHGGSRPPLVVGPGTTVGLTLEGGHAGLRGELDGQAFGTVPGAVTVGLVADRATLVDLGDGEPFVTGLRRRGIITDSPRVLARDEREANAREGALVPGPAA